jgi:hypothetical protein
MSPDQLADLIRRVEEIEERLRTLESRVFAGSPYTPPVGLVGYTGPLAPATSPTRESPELDIDDERAYLPVFRPDGTPGFGLYGRGATL